MRVFKIDKEKNKMVENIIDVLMKRDEMTQKEAEQNIEMAREDLHTRLAEGEMPFDICGEWFGLEEDYIWELI